MHHIDFFQTVHLLVIHSQNTADKTYKVKKKPKNKITKAFLAFIAELQQKLHYDLCRLFHMIPFNPHAPTCDCILTKYEAGVWVGVHILMSDWAC